MTAPLNDTPGPPMPESGDEIRLERLRRQRRRYPLAKWFAANLRDNARILTQSWVSLTALLSVLAIGTAYLHYFYHLGQPDLEQLDWAAAFYNTLQLVVFQSGLAFPADAVGRTLFVAIPLIGLFFLLQSVVDVARLLFDKRMRREAWQVSLASTFSNHIIVCGLGRIGYRVVLQLLDTGYDVVVVEIDGNGQFVPIILGLKVPVILGDARNPDVLKRAGLAQSHSVITAINDDLQNIEVALTARRQRAQVHTVMRIYNQQLDVNLERSFGHNTAFNSSALAAPTLTASIISREIKHVLVVPQGLLGVSEILIAHDSEINSFVRNVEETFDVRVLRNRDARGRTRGLGFGDSLEAGNSVLFLGTLDALEQLRTHNEPKAKIRAMLPKQLQRPTAHFNTVIVCGLGRLSSEVLRMLRSSQPQLHVVLICAEDTPQRAFDDLEALGVDVLRGDAREASMLREAGIAQAYSVAALFNDDLMNLQIGLAARAVRDDIHLVLRVFSDVLARRLAELFDIHTAFSSSALAAPTLAAAVVLQGVERAFDIGEQLFATIRVPIADQDEFAGQTVATLRSKFNVVVIAVQRNRTPLQPLNHDTELAAGDEAMLLADLATLARLGQRGTRTRSTSPALRSGQ